MVMVEIPAELHIAILAGIVVPVGTAICALIWKIFDKIKRIDLLAARVKAIEKDILVGIADHNRIFVRLGDVEKQNAGMEAKLDILIRRKI